mgnify:CR=1 FL=1
MSSFRRKLEAGLARRGIEVTHDLGREAQAVLVIGGTKDLPGLWNRRRRGARLVQRLDGMNWIHRKRRTWLRHFLRAEYGNALLALIRSRLADHIVYQSEFSRDWWRARYGPEPGGCSVVRNGVDLDEYRPAAQDRRPPDRCRLLVVEGSLGGGYDMGLDNAVALAETLAGSERLPVELMVVGAITPDHRARVQARAHVPILWGGVLEPHAVIEAMQSAHLLFSADLHPACPNSVIEAMACGLPVAAFDTGAVRELVQGGAGAVVPYGGDPWNIDPPDIPGLARAAAAILRDPAPFRAAARAEAGRRLGLDAMLDGYLKALLEG